MILAHHLADLFLHLEKLYLFFLLLAELLVDSEALVEFLPVERGHVCLACRLGILWPELFNDHGFVIRLVHLYNIVLVEEHRSSREVNLQLRHIV